MKSKVATEFRVNDGIMLLCCFVSGVNSLHTHVETQYEIAEIQTELSKPEVYTDAKRIVELQKELSDLNSELEKAYDRFGELDSI